MKITKTKVFLMVFFFTFIISQFVALAGVNLECEEDELEIYCTWDKNKEIPMYFIQFETAGSGGGGEKTTKNSYRIENGDTGRLLPNRCSEIDGEPKAILYACPSKDTYRDCEEEIDSTYITYSYGCEEAEEDIRHEEYEEENSDDDVVDKDRNPRCSITCNRKSNMINCEGECTDPDHDLVSIHIDRDDDSHGPIDFYEDFSARKSNTLDANYNCDELGKIEKNIVIVGEDDRGNDAGNNKIISCKDSSSDSGSDEDYDDNDEEDIIVVEPNRNRKPICSIQYAKYSYSVNVSANCEDTDGDMIGICINRTAYHAGPIDFCKDFAMSSSQSMSVDYNCKTLGEGDFTVGAEGWDTRNNRDSKTITFHCDYYQTPPTIITPPPPTPITPTTPDESENCSNNPSLCALDEVTEEEDISLISNLGYSSSVSDEDYARAQVMGAFGVVLASQSSSGSMTLGEEAAQKMANWNNHQDMLKMLDEIEKANPATGKSASTKAVTLAENSDFVVKLRTTKAWSKNLNQHVVKSNFFIEPKTQSAQHSIDDFARVFANDAKTEMGYFERFDLWNWKFGHADMVPLKNSIDGIPLEKGTKEAMKGFAQTSSGDHAGWLMKRSDGSMTKAVFDVTNPNTNFKVGEIEWGSYIDDTTDRLVYHSNAVQFGGDPSITLLSESDQVLTPVTSHTTKVAKNLKSASFPEWGGYQLTSRTAREATIQSLEDGAKFSRTLKIERHIGSTEAKLAMVSKSTGKSFKGLNPRLLKYGGKVLKVVVVVGIAYMVYDVGKNMIEGNYEEAACIVVEGVGCWAGGEAGAIIVAPIAALTVETAVLPVIIEGAGMIGGCIGGIYGGDKLCHGVATMINGQRIELSEEEMARTGLDELTTAQRSASKAYFSSGDLSVQFEVAMAPVEILDNAKRFTSSWSGRIPVIRILGSKDVYALLPSSDGKSLKSITPLFPSQYANLTFSTVTIDEFFKDFDQFIVSKMGDSSASKTYCPIADFNKDGAINIEDLEDYYNVKYLKMGR